MNTINYLLTLWLLLASSFCSAQWNVTIVETEPDTLNYEGVWINKHDYRILKNSMRAAYRKPAGFLEVNREESFKEDYASYAVLRYATQQLRSDDGECVVFFQIFEPLTSKDTTYITYNKHKSPDDPLRVIDMQHMGQIRADILHALGYDVRYFLQGRNDVDWRRYLGYYPEKKARRKFNADTAFRVSLNLNPENKYYNYEGKYKYLDALMIQKMGRGFIPIYVFTTEKGHKKLPAYWKKIEGIFRYED